MGFILAACILALLVTLKIEFENNDKHMILLFSFWLGFNSSNLISYLTGGL